MGHALHGIEHSRCSNCDTDVDVQRHRIIGGPVDPKAAIYQCDRKKGGCGHLWEETTEAGGRHNISVGSRPGNPTPERARGRRTFVMPALPWKQQEATS